MDRTRRIVRTAGLLCICVGVFGLVISVLGSAFALLQPSAGVSPLEAAIYFLVSGAYYGFLLAVGRGLRRVTERGRRLTVAFLLTHIALHVVFCGFALFTVLGPPVMRLPASQIAGVAALMVAVQATLWGLVLFFRSARIRQLFQAA